MLILGRRDGQWITVVHGNSGDILRIRVSNIQSRNSHESPRCDLVFDDPGWRFLIDRAERREAEAQGRIIPFGKSFS